ALQPRAVRAPGPGAGGAGGARPGRSRGGRAGGRLSAGLGLVRGIPSRPPSGQNLCMATAVPDTLPIEIEEPVDDRAVAPDRPWIVIVWNDPINLMSYVTFVFQKLFGYSKAKATKLMLDVHQKGRAIVSSGSRERAELDVFRLHEHGLWATMEHEA